MRSVASVHRLPRRLCSVHLVGLAEPRVQSPAVLDVVLGVVLRGVVMSDRVVDRVAFRMCGVVGPVGAVRVVTTSAHGFASSIGFGTSSGTATGMATGGGVLVAE